MIVCESGLPLIGTGSKRGNGPLRVGSVNEPFVGHALERGVRFVLVLDRLDDGDRLTPFRQDDFLACADGLDGLREVLVGFAQSELHVVMLLHFRR